jgi:tetratricopeptide (TPR) repeat protein
MWKSSREGRPVRTPLGPGILVAAMTLVTFLPALRNDFVNWDDVANFLKNPQYRGLSWANIRWMFTTAHLGHYIPVTWLTLGLDYVLWGMNAWGYHLTALLLHTTNALLFYFLAYRMLALVFASASPDPPLTRAAPEDAHQAQNRGADRGLALGAVAAALLFSIHPLRVESVAWITERRDLLAGLFSILTVLAYLEAFSRGTTGRLQTGWRWTSIGLFALALLSKSIVVGLPLALLALDVYPLRRRGLPRLLIEKAPFFLASASVSVLTLVIGLVRRRELMTDLGTLGVAERLAVSAYGFIFYLRKTLVPWPLSPLYELHYPVRPLAATYLISGLAVLVISTAAIGLRHRWPAGLTVWAAYIALLLPVCGVLQNGHQIAADRYTYLACLGWALMAGAGVAWCCRAKAGGFLAPRLSRLILALALTAIAAFAALTPLQIRVWRDSETLWRHAVALDPNSAFAHFHLAGTFSILGKHQQARAEYAKAIALISDALETKGLFYAWLGYDLQTSGDLEGAERSYTTALRYAPDNTTALTNLGVMYALRGDDRAALDLFVRLLRVVPGYDAACRNVSILSVRLGVKPREMKECPGTGAAADRSSPASPEPRGPVALGKPVESRAGQFHR